MEITEKQKKAALDTITTALEQGIGYWAKVRKIKRTTDGGLVESFEVSEQEPSDGIVRKEFGTIGVSEVVVAAHNILSGQLDVRRDIVAQFIGFDDHDDDVDAEGADVAVQIAYYGEIVWS